MNNEPSTLAVVACLAIHNIDKLAIGVDYERGSKSCWSCQKCGHTFLCQDLPRWHKYYLEPDSE